MPVCSQIPSCRPAKGRAHLEPELALQLGAWHAAEWKAEGAAGAEAAEREQKGGGDGWGRHQGMCWAWQNLERCTRCSWSEHFRGLTRAASLGPLLCGVSHLCVYQVRPSIQVKPHSAWHWSTSERSQPCQQAADSAAYGAFPSLVSAHR